MSWPKAWVKIPEVFANGNVTVTVVGFDHRAYRFNSETQEYTTRPLLWVKARVPNPEKEGWSIEKHFVVEPEDVTCVNTEAAEHYDMGDKIYRVIGVGYGADEKLRAFKEEYETH